MQCRTAYALFNTLTVAAVLAVAGCVGPMTRGMGAYDHARYTEALEALQEAEGEALRWRGRERARYALYRGLVHLALGDRESTARWLGEAEEAAARDPRLFGDEDTGRLSSALAHLPARR